MSASQKRVYTNTVNTSNRKDTIKCVIEKIIYLGYLQLYDVELSKKDKVLEKLAVGDEINYDKITAMQKYTKTKGRYTEASLIKELEKKELVDHLHLVI